MTEQPVYIKPINLDRPLHDFVVQHGVPVAQTILEGAPKAATLFVYAYVAKSIDYLRIDEEGRWLVFSNNIWKPVARLIVPSFVDIAYSLKNLKTAVHGIQNESSSKTL